MPAITVENIAKSYKIWRTPISRLTNPILHHLGNRFPKSSTIRHYFQKRCQHNVTDFWALRDISFEVAKGESIGILGRNGSGKSTLLQLIAGTLKPTTGTITIRGRTAALLELGSGFDLEFTGRENVYLNGSILGLSRAEIDNRFDAIAAFADIGEFLEQPVKTYSSGMVVRLAFSVQVQIDPEILIVDEALAVGDALFQKRCFQQMEKLRSRGTTLVFVSHDQESVRTLTSRAILLKSGKIFSQGPSSDVILDYRRTLHEEEELYYTNEANRRSVQDNTPRKPGQTNSESRSETLSFGSFDAIIQKVTVLDGAGEPKNYFLPGDDIRIQISCLIIKPLKNLNISVRIRNKEGIKLYSWGTLNQDIAIWSGKTNGTIFWERNFHEMELCIVEFSFDCPLGMNLYEIQAAISEEKNQFYNEQRILHWRDEAAFFQVGMSPTEYFFGGVSDLRMSARVLTESR